MIKLIWIVSVLGGAPQEIPYPQTFEAKALCEDYGADHITNMQDWVRGSLHWSFEMPVLVAYRCQAEERPA